MVQANELAEKSAQICAAVLAFGTAGAAGITSFMAPLAALGGMGLTYLQGRRARCLDVAVDRTLMALKQVPELADANMERARLLIDASRGAVKIDAVRLLSAHDDGAAGMRLYMVQQLMDVIPFQADDQTERRAVELALNAAIDCLWADPDLQAGLTQDLIINMARAQRVQLTIATGTETKIDNMVSLLERSLQTHFPVPLPEEPATQFELGVANAVVLGWFGRSFDWWENTGKVLRSALDRLTDADQAALVPQPWNFNKLEGNADALAHAKGGLWKALSDANSPHIATVVRLGNTLGPDLPIDSRFAERLLERRLLTDHIGERGFFVAHGIGALRRSQMIAAGNIPITPEVRLALETLMAKLPLLVWDDSEEPRQDAEVGALLRWFAEQGTAVCDGATAARADRWAFDFVADAFDIATTVVRNPYRKLDHYLSSDADDYVGRDDEAALAAAWLRRALDDSADACLRVGGPSGVGKSSFLHARVAPLALGAGLVFCTFRPTDFQQHPGQVFSPTSEFCDRLDDLLGTRSGLENYPLIHSPNMDLARRDAGKWIGQLRARGSRLLLALDQFEEILDHIANDWNAPAWNGLLLLIGDLVRHAGSLVCVTLESSRGQIAQDLPAARFLKRATEITLKDGDGRFLSKVISEPFANAGLRLSEELVERLVQETRLHQQDIGSNASALPLLSLKLYGLFAELSQRTALNARTASRSFSGAATEVTIADLDGYPLSIAEEIANLADRAWTETDGGSLDDLDTFMRPYVQLIPVEGSREARVVLQAVPARSFYSIATRQAAFVRRRLIVPTAGGFRLVHESVLRRWDFGRQWLERERESLLKQTALATRARIWHAAGRPPITSQDNDDIHMTAKILSDAIVDWTAHQLTDSAAIERDYCVALFQQATDPRALVMGSTKKSCFIHLAASYGLVDLVERFLDRDAEAVNLVRADGRTPLHSAAWFSLRTTELLLERHADPNITDEDGFAAIDSAIWSGHPNIFKLLLPHADPGAYTSERVSPLFGAARRGQHWILEQLELRGFRHDAATKDDCIPLIGASIGGDAAMFETCLRKGDPRVRTRAAGLNTLDHLAALGRIALIKRLMRHPLAAECLEPHPQTGMTALMWAASALMSKTVAHLLRLDVDPNTSIRDGDGQGRTALHFCVVQLTAYKGRAPRFVVDKTRTTLEVLLARDAIDVAVAASNGDTVYGMLLHYPALRDLVVAHPSFKAKTLPASVETPLERALRERNRALVENMLAQLRHRDVVDRINANGETPALLMMAAGYHDLLRQLIADGQIDPWQATPRYPGLLYRVWQSGDHELMQLVLERLPVHVSAAQLAAIAGWKSAAAADSRGNTLDMDDAILDRCLAGGPAAGALESALLQAGLHGNERLFRKLIAAGADGRQQDDWGRSILDRSADGVARSAAVQADIVLADARKTSLLPRAIWSSTEQQHLTFGNLAAISAMLAERDPAQLVDAWERWPADLVPDQCQDAVRDLISRGTT